MAEEKANYALKAAAATRTFMPPELAYRPRTVDVRGATIGLIGCGGIAATHLAAYQSAGYQVLMLCDRTLAKAEAFRDQYFSGASVTTDYREVLANPDVRFVDLTPYPTDRYPLIEAALRAGKHVLSQKPLVSDVAQGWKLVELADELRLKLAVNQNGRWAPHFAYAREAVRSGLLGEVTAVRQAVRWDHNWIKNLPFNLDQDIVLRDFGIHWFDFVVSVMGKLPAIEVLARKTKSPAQQASPPLLAQVMITYPSAQVSLIFDADTRFHPWDETTIIGTRGVLCSRGPSLNEQQLRIETADGVCEPALCGHWFPDGFHGAMAELIWAVEHHVEPLHGARENLSSLALCQRAVDSADTAT